MRIAFIGGTGRCGTNILIDILSRHSRVAALPFEHKLFIDPDGLIDFYKSYRQAWSPFWADRRLQRLERFLEDVSRVKPLHRAIDKILSFLNRDGKVISPRRYSAWELAKHFPRFEQHSRELVTKLTDFTYEGVWHGMKSYTYKPHIRHGSPKKREALRLIIGQYMRNVIGDYIASKKAEVFVEDNTWNIFFARELIELLSECKIVHIYRDPRDVVASFSQQRWCPSNKIEAALFYKSMMEYWLDEIRGSLPSDSFYEMSLESLVDSTEITLKDLCVFLELPFEGRMLDIDLSKSHSGRWKKDFSEPEKDEISDVLGSIIRDLGYE